MAELWVTCQAYLEVRENVVHERLSWKCCLETIILLLRSVQLLDSDD